MHLDPSISWVFEAGEWLQLGREKICPGILLLFFYYYF